MDCIESLILDACKEICIFETNPFIDGVIYNHKSIFDYNLKFKVIFVNTSYSMIEDEIYREKIMILEQDKKFRKLFLYEKRWAKHWANYNCHKAQNTHNFHQKD